MADLHAETRPAICALGCVHHASTVYVYVAVPGRGIERNERERVWNDSFGGSGGISKWRSVG